MVERVFLIILLSHFIIIKDLQPIPIIFLKVEKKQKEVS